MSLWGNELIPGHRYEIVSKEDNSIRGFGEFKRIYQNLDHLVCFHHLSRSIKKHGFVLAESANQLDVPTDERFFDLGSFTVYEPLTP
jgi:hypothetical protein